MSHPLFAQSSRRVSARSGFTLIELLTVVAIIGILAAIIIPVVSQVRDKAKATECVSNIRQWSHAFMSYANDNKGKYVINTAAGGNGTWWYQIGSGASLYAPYFSKTRDYTTLTTCGSESLNVGSNTIATTCYVMARPSSGTVPLAYNNINLRGMTNPSRTLMMVERSFDVSSGGFNSGSGYYLYIQQSTALANAAMFTRHNGAMNAVFADGHVEQLVRDGSGSNSWRGATNGVSNSDRWLSY